MPLLTSLTLWHMAEAFVYRHVQFQRPIAVNKKVMPTFVLFSVQQCIVIMYNMRSEIPTILDISDCKISLWDVNMFFTFAAGKFCALQR